MVKKIFIIGAGRSGTNLLRDILCEFDDFGTWPCDEINYIWKHRNLKNTLKSDRLSNDNFSSSTKKYLEKKFKEISIQTSSKNIVEKTCANSMRVEYIFKNFPNSKFIFIHRNGFDVILSSLKRWKGKTSSKYLKKKFRYMPVSDIWFHLPNLVFTKIYKIIFGEYFKWGPIYNGIVKDKSRHGLKYVATKQWIKCIEYSLNDLKKIPKEQVLTLSYDDLIFSNQKTIKKICNFLKISFDNDKLEKIKKMIDFSKVNLKRDYSVFTTEEKNLIEKYNNKINEKL